MAEPGDLHDLTGLLAKPRQPGPLLQGPEAPRRAPVASSGAQVRLQARSRKGLVQLAQRQGLNVPVIPVGIGYGQAPPRPLSRAALCFGEPMTVPTAGGRETALRFNQDLAQAMHTAEQAARAAVGRPLESF